MFLVNTFGTKYSCSKSRKCQKFNKDRKSVCLKNKSASKAKDHWLNGKNFTLPLLSNCHLSQSLAFSFSPSPSPLYTCKETDTWKHTHTKNTPLYLQKAWGRQSAWINSLSAYISIPAYPTANKTQFTVNELLRHSWGSLTVTLHSTPITNSRKKSIHTH